MKEASHQKHGGASSVDVGKDGDQDGTKEGSSSREAVPDDSKNETITDLSNVSFRAKQLQCLQLSTSSLRIHGGAIFSAVSGRKSIPISAIEAPEHGACYRVHGFYLTTTFCLNPAQQAVSL